MCGTPVHEQRGWRLTVPWADLTLVLVIVLVGALWWQYGQRIGPNIQSITIAPTPTPTVQATTPPTPVATTTPAPTPTPTPFPASYQVQSGDTLSGIAARHGVPLVALLEINNLQQNAVIQPGQQLALPTPSAPPPVAAPERAPGLYDYEVKRGDTLISIASQFGVRMERLLEANNLSEDSVLFPGQLLKIPIEPADAAAMMTAPTMRWPPPTVLGPPNNAIVQHGTPVLLRWLSVGTLAVDEWYVVRIWSPDPDAPQPDSIWTRTTSQHLPDYWFPPAGDEPWEVRWQVTVIEIVGEKVPDQSELAATSPTSGVRTLFLHSSSAD